jgi:hypothetical protein
VEKRWEGCGGRKERGGREGLKDREVKRRKGGEGERNLDPRCSRQIDATEHESIKFSVTVRKFTFFFHLLTA